MSRIGRPLHQDYSMETSGHDLPSYDHPSDVGNDRSSTLSRIVGWIERIDPGTHRLIKGLRLVTAYGIAALLGTLPSISHGFRNGVSLSFLAGGFALWASVSEARIIRRESSRDLALLCGGAVLGALIMIGLAPKLVGAGRPGAELTLAVGAFLAGYLK